MVLMATRKEVPNAEVLGLCPEVKEKLPKVKSQNSVARLAF